MQKDKRVWKYTYQSIADGIGCGSWKVKRAAYAGKIVMSDIVSVAKWISMHLAPEISVPKQAEKKKDKKDKAEDPDQDLIDLMKRL